MNRFCIRTYCTVYGKQPTVKYIVKITWSNHNGSHDGHMIAITMNHMIQLLDHMMQLSWITMT